MRNAVLIGVLLTVVGGMAIEGFADSWQNELLWNRTGRDANDLEKWLVGDVRISRAYSTHFHDFDYLYDATEDVTKLRWSNGTVPDGASTST